MTGADEDPRLRIVIVNHNGGELLDRAVTSALAARWPGPRQVVIVDNASEDDSLGRVDGRPGVTILRTRSNEGFVAANRGFADLLGRQPEVELRPCDRVLLLNPDAEIDGAALLPLERALGAGSRAGAAAPHIVFDRPFVDLPVDGGKVEIERVVAGGADVGGAVIPLGSAYRLPGGRGPVWLAEGGDGLRIPLAEPGPLELIVRADGPARIADVAVSGSSTVVIESEPLDRHTIVQNAGSEIGPHGEGRNRGFGDVDGSVKYPAAVPAWCGAAVLFDADYLGDVGGFEPSYFLYYEDIDLARRGRTRGWSTVYVADARVRHRHSQSTVQGSRLVEVLQHRNRLVTVARHDPAGAVVRAFGRAALTPLSLVASAARDRGPGREARLRLARWRTRALVGAVAALPSARRARRSMAGGQAEAGATADFIA